jgi:DNA-binding transcriptional LysR family regulator
LNTAAVAGKMGGPEPYGVPIRRIWGNRAANGNQRGANSAMMNIPTDLLRTLISVVDLHSFTKAAKSLGVTQPAVSAQIKRLQFLLGYDVFDKRTPGVSLTPRGQVVVDQARRLLSINDEILKITGSRPGAKMMRVGIPGDYSGSRIPVTLARFRLRWPAAGRSRRRPRGQHHGAGDQAAAHVAAQGRVGAQRRHPDRSAASGAARLLWR